MIDPKTTTRSRTPLLQNTPLRTEAGRDREAARALNRAIAPRPGLAVEIAQENLRAALGRLR